ELKDIDRLSTDRPRGAFYVFPRVDVGMESASLAERILKETNVAVTRGARSARPGKATSVSRMPRLERRLWSASAGLETCSRESDGVWWCPSRAIRRPPWKGFLTRFAFAPRGNEMAQEE